MTPIDLCVFAKLYQQLFLEGDPAIEVIIRDVNTKETIDKVEYPTDFGLGD